MRLKIRKSVFSKHTGNIYFIHKYSVILDKIHRININFNESLSHYHFNLLAARVSSSTALNDVWMLILSPQFL